MKNQNTYFQLLVDGSTSAADKRSKILLDNGKKAILEMMLFAVSGFMYTEDEARRFCEEYVKDAANA